MHNYFSSVTVATEPLRTRRQWLQKQFESCNILELGYQAACGGGEVCVPQNNMRALCAVIRPDHNNGRGPNKKSKNKRIRLRNAEIQEPSDLVRKLQLQ